MEKNLGADLWKNRESNLENLKRYGSFSVMFYRTNLLIHKKRLRAILERILPTAMSIYEDIDPELTLMIAEHHDDFELTLEEGDISLLSKLKMTSSELGELKQKEILAAKKIASLYPKEVSGYDYYSLLSHAIHKNSKEAQLVSIADKIDGYCEAIHELLAGNTIFLEPVINYVTKTFVAWPKKLSLVKKVFLADDPFFSFPIVDMSEYFDSGRLKPSPHSELTLQKKIGIPQYELWKEVTINTLGVEILITQKEFHN